MIFCDFYFLMVVVLEVDVLYQYQSLDWVEEVDVGVVFFKFVWNGDMNGFLQCEIEFFQGSDWGKNGISSGGYGELFWRLVVYGK